jgi:dTMP kinase
MLAMALEHAGIAVCRTREPGGSPGAEAIRRLLLEGEGERWDGVSEALLFAAARHDHVSRLIAPAIDAGTWVVCDRFADSTLAYQGYARGLPLAMLAGLQRIAIGSFMPDLTVILDLPVASGLARAGRRGAADRFERLDHEFHERLREGYRRIAAEDPERCVVIDASRSSRAVHRTILAVVEARLGLALAARSSAS